MRVRSKVTQITSRLAAAGLFAAATGVVQAAPPVVAVVPAVTTTCKTVAACIFGVNSSTGYGVEGSSTGNDGVVGITTVKATKASLGKSGVSGYDNSTNKNTYNSGVYGTSPYGNGVEGKSPHGIGVAGSGATAGIFGTGGTYGVYGSGHTGVYGYSAASTGQALYAEGAEGADLLYAVQDYDGTSSTGDGVVVSTAYGAGLSSTSGRGIPLFLSITDEGDTLIDAQGPSVGDAMVLDVYGDLTLAGTLTQNDAARFATRRADGAKVMTYGPRETEPTLEDTGEVNLVNGAVRVGLDPSFAATVDLHRSYLVFVTAEGDNAGMYVTQKTAGGFTIRESHGGRSSIPVQYRVVARPLNDKAQRLAAVTSVFPHGAQFLREKQEILARQAARVRNFSAQRRLGM